VAIFGLNNPSMSLELKFQLLVLPRTEGIYIIPLNDFTTIGCTGTSRMWGNRGPYIALREVLIG